MAEEGRLGRTQDPTAAAHEELRPPAVRGGQIMKDTSRINLTDHNEAFQGFSLQWWRSEKNVTVEIKINLNFRCALYVVQEMLMLSKPLQLKPLIHNIAEQHVDHMFYRDIDQCLTRDACLESRSH